MAANIFRRRMESLRTLGLEPSASPTTVREAYLRLAKQHHPDIATGCKVAAQEQFQRISVAYEVLTGKGPQLARSAAQQYEDLMAARAREPWIIRYLWRGPAVRVKFQLKLSVMVALLVAAIVDNQDRDGRRRRR